MSLLTENYTLEQLRSHIKKKLGGSVWRLEGMSLSEEDVMDQAITDALLPYSRRCPLQHWEILTLSASRSAYSLKNSGYGPWRVDFIEPTPLVAPLISSLLGVTPMSTFSGTDIAGFVNWRKTLRRVMSAEPIWTWDEVNKKIYISNINNISRACVYIYLPVSFDDVPLIHKDYIRRASIAHTKKALGIIRRKFKAIPGPGGNTITLDGDEMVKEAEADLTLLEKELMDFQPRALPLFD